jgi:hypothetical protein
MGLHHLSENDIHVSHFSVKCDNAPLEISHAPESGKFKLSQFVQSSGFQDFIYKCIDILLSEDYAYFSVQVNEDISKKVISLKRFLYSSAITTRYTGSQSKLAELLLSALSMESRDDVLNGEPLSVALLDRVAERYCNFDLLRDLNTNKK